MLNVKKLYELMEEREIPSLMALSRISKIPYTTIGYMVSGHDMYVGTLVELSKFFDVPLDYLINKSYGVVLVSDEGEVQLETSSLLESIMSMPM